MERGLSSSRCCPFTAKRVIAIQKTIINDSAKIYAKINANQIRRIQNIYVPNTGYDQNNGRRNTGIDYNIGKNGYDEASNFVNKAVRNNGIDQITGKITYDGFIPLFQS